MSHQAIPVVTGAVEGDLDEAVILRVVEHAGLLLGEVHGLRGKPSLLQSLGGYNNAARFAPWLVVIDLDGDCDCAPPCVQQWLPNPSAQMCFRVSVRAIEAWLLADRERMAQLLGIALNQIPQNPDSLDNPKRTLVNLARQSPRRAIRDDLVPRAGSGRAVGSVYNTRMIEFVQDATRGWRPDTAEQVSDSLARCLRRLHAFRTP